MPTTVFAHIGLPKTGTTHLQALLYANRGAFQQQGTTVVGRHRMHFDAASEITGARGRRTGEIPSGRWVKVVRAVEKVTTPQAVFSSERYSLARPPGARTLVETLCDSSADAEVHVIVTLRDLVAAEPSAWQEYVKNGGTRSWPEFCAAGVADPDELRRRRRVRRLFAAWPEVLPPEHLHVVTVPPPGCPHGLLFERFCSVLGVDPAAMDTLEGRANSSLDFVATEMLRRVNARRPRLPVPVQRAEIKKFLANGALSRRDVRIRPALSGEALALARAENEWVTERLRSGGHDVVGDLADLHGDHPDAPASYDVPAEDLLDAALEAVALLATRSAERGAAERGTVERPRGRAKVTGLLGREG